VCDAAAAAAAAAQAAGLRQLAQAAGLDTSAVPRTGGGGGGGGAVVDSGELRFPGRAACLRAGCAVLVNLAVCR
jgi:hypothetical protein